MGGKDLRTMRGENYLIGFRKLFGTKQGSLVGFPSTLIVGILLGYFCILKGMCYIHI